MQDLTPTSIAKANSDQNENQLQAEGESVRIRLHSQYEKVWKRSKDPSGRRENSLGSSSSTDIENKSSSCSAEDQKKKYKEKYNSSSTDREHRSSSYSIGVEEKKHRSTKYRKNTHLKKDGGYESNLHKEQRRSKSSNSVREEKKDEPIYAEIINQCVQPLISSSDRDKLHSHNISSETTNFLDYKGLKHGNIQPVSASALSEPLGTYSSSDKALVLSTKSSAISSHKSDERRRNSEDNTHGYSWLKFKTKLGYSIYQRAFVTSSVAFATFITSYLILMPKYHASIQNLTKDLLLSIPIAIASVLFLASMTAFISSLRDTRIKVIGDKDDNEVFKQIKSINNKKCIKSIKLYLSNNTRYTLLDGRKYKTLAFKKLALTLNRPLICAETVAFATLTSTYLLTKYFEVGYKNLSSSLSTFNTSNIELIGFTTTASTILALFIYSFIHYYRKECVEGLELKECPRKIESFNEEYIREAESHYNNRDALLSGKHSENKAASLTIDQALVEYYNSRAIIITN